MQWLGKSWQNPLIPYQHTFTFDSLATDKQLDMLEMLRIALNNLQSQRIKKLQGLTIVQAPKAIRDNQKTHIHFLTYEPLSEQEQAEIDRAVISTHTATFNTVIGQIEQAYYPLPN